MGEEEQGRGVEAREEGKGVWGKGKAGDLRMACGKEGRGRRKIGSGEGKIGEGV